MNEHGARARLVAAAIVGVVVMMGITGFTPLPRAEAAGLERFVIAPESSTVTYRVPETFFDTNQLTVAVGTTNAVRGEILVDRAAPRNSRIGTITVDISTFKSDHSRRDQMIRKNWLESEKFPTAEFTPTEITGLPQTVVNGREIPLVIKGNLKIRDAVRPVTFAASIALVQDTLRGTARTTIRMTDFGFDPPSLIGILKAENKADLELTFTARRVP